MQVAFAIILGWLVFSELPSAWSNVGGGLIILGVFVNIAYRDKNKKRSCNPEAFARC